MMKKTSRYVEPAFPLGQAGLALLMQSASLKMPFRMQLLLRLIAIAVCLATADLPALGQSSREADKAVSQLDLYPGLEATLFASEPKILSPTNIDVDNRGRVWVCEVVNYRAHAQNNKRSRGDRILILEDTDGDGKADSQKVFYQGRDVDAALGICVLGKRVIVTCAPNVIVFTDEDDDDQPDSKRLLFTQTGRAQDDHSTHSFVFGPDGKFYWNMGNNGGFVHDANGKLIVDTTGNHVLDRRQIGRFNNARTPYWGGMIFRCNPDGSEFEVLGHNFRNNYEVAVDSFGNVWQSDNDDDGNYGVRINYILEGGNYGYREETTGAGWRKHRISQAADIPSRHWHQNDPGVVPNFVQTGAGSPTGITLYEGELLPEIFHNQVIHCDAGPGVVWAAKAKPDGGGFSGEMIPLVKGERDKWFRPVDVAVAPDGALLVSDWYDPVIGWNRQADSECGRIYRIAPIGHRQKNEPLGVKNGDQAIIALKSPNLDTRHLAWQALRDMGDDAIPYLDPLYAAGKPHHRARALWLLSRIDSAEGAFIDRALDDPDASIRVVGLRAARQLKQRIPFDLAKRIRHLVNDPSERVLTEAAIALRDVDADSAPQLWTRLAKRHTGDRWFLEALGLAADGRWNECLSAWLKETPFPTKTTIDRQIIWRSRGSKTTRLLGKALGQQGIHLDETKRLIRALDFQPDGEAKDTVLLRHAASFPGKLSSRNILLKGEMFLRLAKSKTAKRSEYEVALNRYLNQAKNTTYFVSVVDALGLRERQNELVDLAMTHLVSALGQAALNVLFDNGSAAAIQAKLKDGSPEEISALIAALAESKNGDASALLTSVFLDPSKPIAVRETAVRGVANASPGQLVDLAASGKFPDNLKPTAGAALAKIMHVSVRNRAKEYFPIPALKGATELPQMTELLVYVGNRERGQTVFEQANCAQCHQIGGNGINFGPDLSEIGNKLSKQGLYESILDPSATVSPAFQAVHIERNDGKAFSGFATSDTPEELTLRQVGGVTSTHKKSAIRKKTTSAQSLMPAGLQQLMTFDDLVDLVEYLANLKAR